MSLSIIVPTLNEADNIATLLTALSPLRQRDCEVIVVDGGSTDPTASLAAPLADHVITAPRGRAAQMNAGAEIAKGAVLLFLHADTTLPPNADKLVLDGTSRARATWGRFDLRIAGQNPLLALIAFMINLRSRITGIATGDQAIFVAREAFNAAEGFPDIPLMEDVALSKRLKRIARPLCLSARVTTSGRRWEANGIVRTTLLIWRLRWAYYFGAEPAGLARRYGYAPREG